MDETEKTKSCNCEPFNLCTCKDSAAEETSRESKSESLRGELWAAKLERIRIRKELVRANEENRSLRGVIMGKQKEIESFSSRNLTLARSLDAANERINELCEQIKNQEFDDVSIADLRAELVKAVEQLVAYKAQAELWEKRGRAEIERNQILERLSLAAYPLLYTAIGCARQAYGVVDVAKGLAEERRAAFLLDYADTVENLLAAEEYIDIWHQRKPE